MFLGPQKLLAHGHCALRPRLVEQIGLEPMTDKGSNSNFEITSKRRKGFPSETQVKRGARI
jgi:hypothetical protein